MTRRIDPIADAAAWDALPGMVVLLNAVGEALHAKDRCAQIAHRRRADSADVGAKLVRHGVAAGGGEQVERCAE